eukprot:TRINITY_DN2606_c0_g4_i1.p1 TRINITY_DN2606_c0_g4~~TRINITY_DN2606_c0_g4_i1.p1  ORF type:complete len:348 (+),score=62.06 TRINITY_DN2606_c0_g4_i1:828-1871(+)
MEPKHFVVNEFMGRLGIGLTPELLITDIPETSPCYKAGVPQSVVLTHINGGKVESHNDVKEKLSGLQTASSIVVTLKPQDESLAEWWKTVEGTIKAEEEEDEEDAYDPNATEVTDLTKEQPSGVKRLPAYKGLQFKQPVGGYDSEPSDYNSDISDEEQDFWAPPRKRHAVHHPQDRDRPVQSRFAPSQTAYAHPTHTEPSHAGRGEEQSWQDQTGPSSRETPDGLHPCAKSGRRCSEFCNMRHLPSDTCMHFATRGDCSFRSGCRWLHCKQGLNQEGFNYQCDTCQLSLARKQDYQNHRKSRAHQVLSQRQAETQAKQAGLNNRAQSLLAQFRQKDEQPAEAAEKEN